MPTEITMPVIVRIGETEGRWGEITIETQDGEIDEVSLRRETAAFFRAAADRLENPGQDDEEADGGTP